MHTSKNRFTLAKDLIHTVSKLPNDKAGELFKYILSFVNNQDPISNDIVINLAFEPIKHDILRDSSIRINRSIARRASTQAKEQTVTNGDKTEQMVTNDDKTEQTVTNDDKQEQMVTNGDKQEQMVTNPNDVPVVGSKKKNDD